MDAQRFFELAIESTRSLEKPVLRRDSDSQGEKDRWCFERWTVVRGTSENRLRRRRKLERRDNDGAQYLWSRPSAAHVLTEERCRAGRYQPAVIVAADTRRRAPLFVLARSSRGFVRMTTDCAQ